MPSIRHPVIDEVCCAFGSDVKVARHLQITPQAIRNWHLSGLVPKGWCIEIEKLTGIPCERLNPSVDWSFLRTTYTTQNKTRHSNRIVYPQLTQLRTAGK